MKSLWDVHARMEMLRRIDSIDESKRPLWGTMSAGKMLRHLVQALSMANAELPTEARKRIFRYFPLKQLAVYVLPIPKGVPTVPELLVQDEVPIDESRRELHRLMHVFAARKHETKWPVHPAFGKLSKKAWGALAYRHLDHHLRQFGV